MTEHADKKCRNLIRRLHRRNPQAIIAVTGCYAQLRPQEIAAIEGVDIVLGNNDKCDLFKRVAELSGKGRARIYSCDTEQLTSFFAAFSSGDRTRAFLKVQDGCDYCCSYCTIHYARGSSRNMPVADLVREARQIAAAGQKEIVLTGINTGISAARRASGSSTCCGRSTPWRESNVTASRRSSRTCSPTRSSPSAPRRPASCTTSTFRSRAVPTAFCT